MSSPTVRIVEVGPRDGLQNIATQIPTPIKLDLIHRLHQTGLKTIELTSIVSPRHIPQLADCKDLLQQPSIRALGHDNNPDLRLPVLVPNLKGLKIAQTLNVKEIAVFVSATEGFSRANINCSVEVGLARAREVVERAVQDGLVVRGYVSCIFCDPYDGPTSPDAVLRCVQALLQAGCYEVSLGDTLGVGTPAKVHRLLHYLTDTGGIPVGALAGHFHDTYGQAVANVWEAYTCGVRVFDSSVAGLGGCPFAPGAKGNVATEDVVYMFQEAGVETGVDLARLVETGVWIAKQLPGVENGSRAGAALAAKTAAKLPAASLPSPKAQQAQKEVLLPALQWALTIDTEGMRLFRCGVNLKVVLNRPRNGNALTAAMIAELQSVMDTAKSDPAVSRVVITGTGKFFCTGMDLGKKSTPVAQGAESSEAQFARLTELFEVIDQCPKVTIACLNGPAFGGGVGLAFACDIRLCTKAATVTLSEGKLGLCPATISKYVIREWGLAFAREAMLSARPVKSEQLYSLGLVAEVAENPQDLDKRLDALLVRLRQVSPNASRMSKELVNTAWKHAGKDEQASGIKALFHEMMRPDGDGAHGVREFQSGRPVDWDAYIQQTKTTPKARL
ncbi:aldolase [Aspergillus eucalypticola CBS 122712]|uniref:hydroxymethylglutaryl-CoA lyase n=1 Tax=Aspergillus eucalypticola (strain CBS 122712 / IBT 29274) TaxID=1448314 RepID=A0A317UYA9_ASPEC|nr:aldolase [Aspergillus eucalypticola CBS 122712]PWY65928.1 aldolase [Aspergillus eucalypticola CBS 122712]